MKECSKCKIEKGFSEFGKHKGNKDGLMYECKSCRNAMCKKYREDNKEYFKEYYKEWNKKYYLDNKEREDLRYKLRYKNNRGCMNKYYNKYKKNKRDTNPLFKLKSNLRCRTWSAFKIMGYSKTSKTQKILGVDWEIVKSHIERQFTKGMNWNNQGSWHVDHIIPLASAKDEKELLKLCHYSNLQPLWAEDNLSKKDKIVECQVKLRI